MMSILVGRYLAFPLNRVLCLADEDFGFVVGIIP
jgi:hypothetical protein